MYAITTKYLGPTNIKPSRIKAQTGKHSIIISYADCKSFRDPHEIALLKLCTKLNIKEGELIGQRINEDTMVWVFDNARRINVKEERN